MDIQAIRQQFPALKRVDDGQPVIWADAPGGTQVPQRVIDAMSRFLQRGTANLHGDYAASAETDAVLDEARKGAAIFLGARHAEEIHFGQNTSSLHFALSHALADTWKAGDSIIVTNIDHEANVRPWVLAAEKRQVQVREWCMRDDAALHLEDLEALLDDSVVFVAVTAAANALGSIIDIKTVAQMSHRSGALVAVDAVHLAPHRLLDVQDLDCDILTCSAYKFFGPHIGMQWIKQSVGARIPVYKVIPAPNEGAGRFETGTQNFEALAGLYECFEYFSALEGATHFNRKSIIDAFTAIRTHEDFLSQIFFSEIEQIPGINVIGHGPQAIKQRTPTFACVHDELPAKVLTVELANEGIYTWAGHFYAIGVTKALGLEEKGILRIGFAHYHSCDEVRRVCRTLKEIVRSLA